MSLAQPGLLIQDRDGTADLPPFHVKDHEDRDILLPRHGLKLLRFWLKARPEGSPLILLTPERYNRVRRRWDEYLATGKPWGNDYMVNNVVRNVQVHATLADLKLEGSLTVHCF